MIIIVAHHFAVHSGFEFSNAAVTVNRLWVQFIQIGGKIGVDVFVFISGYFLVSAKALKINKVIKIWLQIFTYSAVIFIVFLAFGVEPFGVKALIKHCFPVTFSQWWFASTYFVLYLVSPYINKLLCTFDRKQYQCFLLLLAFCWCVIPTFTGQSYQSNSLLWFVFLYAFAGYLRLFDPKTRMKGATYILLSWALTMLTFLSAVVFDILGTKVSFFGDHATFFYGMQTLPIFAISIFLFIGFSKINIGYKRMINIISSATFGVYLIHDDGFVRPFLWKTVFQNAAYAESNLLIPHSLLAIGVVFIGCTLIELARIYLLEKHCVRAINAAAAVIERLREKISSLSFLEKI